MRKIRVCIGSNDGNNIASTHLGDTEKFYIYDIVDRGSCELVDSRPNCAKTMAHATTDKMALILDQNADVDVLIAQQRSPNFIKIAEQTNHQPIIVEQSLIKNILILLQDEFDEIYHYVQRRRTGETFATIPELLSTSN